MYKHQLKTRNFSFGIFTLNSAANQPRSLQKKKKKEARREESTMLSSVNSVPCSWQLETPGKGCHGEQTASFGGEAWSNFSLLPVNLWLGENTASRGRLGQRLPLPLLWDSFYLEMHVTFYKHCPFCYGCKMLGKDKKKGLHWSRKSNPEGREDSGFTFQLGLDYPFCAK